MGEVDNVKHYDKWLPLKWRSFRSFRERSNPKAYNFVWQGCFFFHYFSQLRRPIGLRFSQVCYFMHIVRYTKWEDWSLTITNIVHCLKVWKWYDVWLLRIFPAFVILFLFSKLGISITSKYIFRVCNFFYIIQ